ncbi:hypothetical protein PHMEG_00018458 [Phytophthora megakarya]|uniref:Uncharacterized protein n=1 Tax=Phytophthora megakarya TaxID=4795 RepID=A0A225VU18_9STRA|nr:hypothetical protein PHMEG_00018458 [Phytophthora megakarya]
MTNKDELNKKGRPVNWHGQSWDYYNNMMELTFAEKDALEYAIGDMNLAVDARAVGKKAFKNA